MSNFTYLVVGCPISSEDRGGSLRMVGTTWHLLLPDDDRQGSGWSDEQAHRIMGGGSGTYLIQNNTLMLRDCDGRVWQINAPCRRAASRLRPASW